MVASSEQARHPSAYIIVCTDLHTAHGLYVAAEDAISVCRQLNKDASDKDCKYVPVPLFASSETTITTGPPSTSTPSTLRRGYL
jgi:hypothetical protein